MPILALLRHLAIHAQSWCMANFGEDIRNLTIRQQFLRGQKAEFTKCAAGGPFVFLGASRAWVRLHVVGPPPHRRFHWACR